MLLTIKSTQIKTTVKAKDKNTAKKSQELKKIYS